MAFWHQHAATKPIARKADKRRSFLCRCGCKAKVGSASTYELSDLVRIPLTYAETHVRKALSKTLHHRHQYIARVHMSRRHAQSSLVRIGMFRSHTADILDIAEDAARDFDNGTARFSKRRNPIAPTNQQLSLQFLLQLTNLLPRPWALRLSPGMHWQFGAAH